MPLSDTGRITVFQTSTISTTSGISKVSGAYRVTFSSAGGVSGVASGTSSSTIVN